GCPVRGTGLSGPAAITSLLAPTPALSRPAQGRPRPGRDHLCVRLVAVETHDRRPAPAGHGSGRLHTGRANGLEHPPERPDNLGHRGRRPCAAGGGPIEVSRPGDRVFFEPGGDCWRGAALLHDLLAVLDVNDKG